MAATAELCIERYLYTPTVDDTLLLLSDLRAEAGSVPRLAAWMGLPQRTVDRWVYRQVSPETPSRRLVWMHWSLAFCPENLVALLARMPRRRRPRSERPSQGARARAKGN